MRKIIFTIFILQLVIPILSGQEWVVPADKKSKLSTFVFDDKTRNAGEKLYLINCISCHGTPGKANYLNLNPPPGDPATEKIQRNNDGEIFFKVNTGRGQMPSFKSVLTSNDIWNLVSFLRSFNKSYIQQVMPVITSTAYPGAIINMFLQYNSADSTIVLIAKAVTGNNTVPVTGAETKLFAHRTFGLLPVDETKTTDKAGVAIFKVPVDLRGDKDGNVRVSARFTNEEIFGSVSKDTVLCAGIKTIPVSLVAQRAMWNNVKKAPIWIILSFGLGLLAAWGFILLVLMKLRDIYIVGESVTQNNQDKEI
jgi:hypothetical protein